jgi:sugar lactone lactonase YvrE
MSTLLKTLALGIALTLAYLLAWPVAVKPVAWQAPIHPGYVAEFAVNQKLETFDALTMGDLSGPEAAISSPDGSIIATTHEGWLVRWDQGETVGTALVNVGGRPLGIDFDSAGNLWIANAYIGLMKLAPYGEITTAVSEVDGIAVRYADDVAVALNGKVYFSDASTRFSAKEYNSTLAASLLDIMEHSDNGRVIEYDPKTDTARTVMDGLTFSNGVAADPQGRFILVVETGEYRVWKHWITGPNLGDSEVIIDNLPGFPDNIHVGQNGRYWVGLTAPRSSALDKLSGKPFWRSVVQRLPEPLRPRIEPYGMVVAIDENGEVLENLQAPNGAAYATTGVKESDEYLYVTSLTAPFLARYKKSDLGISHRTNGVPGHNKSETTLEDSAPENSAFGVESSTVINPDLEVSDDKIQFDAG